MKINKLSLFKSENVETEKIVAYTDGLREAGYEILGASDILEAIENLDDAFGILVDHDAETAEISTFYEFERAYNMTAENL